MAHVKGQFCLNLAIAAIKSHITFGYVNSPIQPMEEELLGLSKTLNLSTDGTVIDVETNIESYITIPSYLSMQNWLNSNNNANKASSN